MHMFAEKQYKIKALLDEMDEMYFEEEDHKQYLEEERGELVMQIDELEDGLAKAEDVIEELRARINDLEDELADLEAPIPENYN